MKDTWNVYRNMWKTSWKDPLGRLSIWRDNIKIDPRETGCEDQRSMELVENRV
jgi:hypothetical protein